MKKLLFTLLVLCSVNMCTHAQDTAQKMRLTFAIDHEHKNALEFTSTDARKLYQFFTDKSEVQTCEAAKMKVISRVYEKSGGNTTYREQNMIKTLNNMGFAVSKLECYAENIVFKLYKSSQKKMMKGVSAIDEFEYMNDVACWCRWKPCFNISCSRNI